MISTLLALAILQVIVGGWTLTLFKGLLFCTCTRCFPYDVARNSMLFPDSSFGPIVHFIDNKLSKAVNLISNALHLKNHPVATKLTKSITQAVSFNGEELL